MSRWYGEDIAYIHDTGHAEFALRSSPGILEILRDGGVRSGLVVDLGCGSGIWARELLGAGYGVLGIDISESMIEFARRAAPEARFRVASLYEAELPPCDAVTAVGEVLNYLFDEAPDDGGLTRLFGCVYGALRGGGVFVFDLAGPGQVPPGERAKTHSLGEDWAVLVEKEEERGILTRRITSFRRVGEHYRRDEEVHRQRLYEPREVSWELRRAGFVVRTAQSYGAFRLPEAHTAFVARKPDGPVR